MNMKVREFSIQTQVSTALDLPAEQIGVIGGENIVQIWIAVPSITDELQRRAAEFVAKLECLSNTTFLLKNP